jgi:hypothetical protein
MEETITHGDLEGAMLASNILGSWNRVDDRSEEF